MYNDTCGLVYSTVGRQIKEISLQEPKKYDLYLSWYFKIIVFVLLAIFTFVGVLLVSAASISEKGSGPSSGLVGFLLLVGLFCLFNVGRVLYWVLTTTHRITVSETGEIIFSSLLRKKRVSELEIESIKPKRLQFGFLVVKTANDKIKLINQFDGFHDFILNLKSKNPTLKIRGC